MEAKIYGILDENNCLIDISKSEKSCKRYATINNYNKIGYRVGYHTFISHVKIGGKWLAIKNSAKRIKNSKKVLPLQKKNKNIMNTIKITLTETRLTKNPNTKTTYIVDSIETKEVTQEQHNLATNDETCKWFRRLGGSEIKQMGYTFLGFVCTKLTSISPDRQIKVMREYSFNKV